MKQKKIFSYLLLAISLTLFTACNGENDVKDDILQTPTYENVSAKFEITDSHSGISSLELTASGNYIVINKKYKSKTDRNTETGLLPNGMFQTDAFATRASVYGNIIYGKFTAIGAPQIHNRRREKGGRGGGSNGYTRPLRRETFEPTVRMLSTSIRQVRDKLRVCLCRNEP